MIEFVEKKKFLMFIDLFRLLYKLKVIHFWRIEHETVEYISVKEVLIDG